MRRRQMKYLDFDLLLVRDPKVDSSSDTDRPVAFLLIPEGAGHCTTRCSGVPQANVIWESVAPGNYSLYAFDEIDDLDYAKPDALSTYSSEATRFEMHPAELKNGKDYSR